jgi:uncharacterized protein
MLAALQPGLVDGLLLLSYPLHPTNRADEPQTAHFSSLQTPALFVHGNRDGFGSFEELTAALKLIPAVTESLPAMGAGHELLTSRNRELLPETVVEGFCKFVLENTDCLYAPTWYSVAAPSLLNSLGAHSR